MRYALKVLVLEPSKIWMPSYVAVNKNATEDGEVRSQIILFSIKFNFLLYIIIIQEKARQVQMETANGVFQAVTNISGKFPNGQSLLPLLTHLTGIWRKYKKHGWFLHGLIRRALDLPDGFSDR